MKADDQSRNDRGRLLFLFKGRHLLLDSLTYGMVFCGAALMIYNIYGFTRFAKYVSKQKAFETRTEILYVPVILLVMFLVGYFAVGFFGKPDLLVSAILFFGSIFVLIIYMILNNITQRILEDAKLREELAAEKKQNEGLHEHVSKMKGIVYTDALTNVKNQASYEKKLKMLDIHAGIQPDYAIVMMDINHLKIMNDKYGHEHGNDYIKGCCHMLCNVYAHSPVYRIGGDEFVTVLKERDYEARYELLEELRKQFRESSSRKDVEPWERYSAAIGMAVRKDGEDSKAVFERADQAMYEEKVAMHAERTD